MYVSALFINRQLKDELSSVLQHLQEPQLEKMSVDALTTNWL